MKIRILCAFALGLVLVVGNKFSSSDVPEENANHIVKATTIKNQENIADLGS